jgi:hypothetical protein
VSGWEDIDIPPTAAGDEGGDDAQGVHVDDRLGEAGGDPLGTLTGDEFADGIGAHQTAIRSSMNRSK